MQHKIHSTVLQCKKHQSQSICLKESFVLRPSLQEWSNKHLAVKGENTFQKLMSMNLSFQKELSPNPLASQWNLEWVRMGHLVHSSIHMVASQFLLLCGFAQIQQSRSSSQLKSNCHISQIAETKKTTKHSHSSKLITTRSLMKCFISVKLMGSCLLL